jgi:hypothetical protein
MRKKHKDKDAPSKKERLTSVFSYHKPGSKRSSAAKKRTSVPVKRNKYNSASKKTGNEFINQAQKFNNKAC